MEKKCVWYEIKEDNRKGFDTLKSTLSESKMQKDRAEFRDNLGK